MNRFASAMVVFCTFAALPLQRASADDETSGEPAKSQVRVGTFDSRLVATAYVRSEAFKKRLAQLHEDLNEAKASGDEKRIKQIEAQGPALQDLIHKQGFSTWPVHDILLTIKDEIPEIAKLAKVDLIVSKWDVVFQRTGLELVDVTDLMVAPFSPSEETRKVLDDLRTRDPVPLNVLEQHQ